MSDRLIDSFGRRIGFVRLSITNRCNLRFIEAMPVGNGRP